MPLGKLTRRQIESAYSVLGEAQKVSDIFSSVFVDVYTINNWIIVADSAEMERSRLTWKWKKTFKFIVYNSLKSAKTLT